MVIILFLSVCFVRFAYSAEESIRVAIAQDASSFSLRVKGYFEVRNLATNQLICKKKNLKKLLVRSGSHTINFAGTKVPLMRLQIAPLKGSSLWINNRTYRGKINLIAFGNRLLVVNELGMEDYLRGVLCNEIAPWWPMDALKAQAIIARTYALYQKQFTKNKDFDLTADVYSQVYGGKTSERWRTNRAVDLTRAKILTFQGNLFPTYYHATCGGKTEDAAQLWKIDLVPLKGVACNFCAHSPHFKWQAQLPLQEMKEKLLKKGFIVEDIAEIEITGSSPSGRIASLGIKGKGTSIAITAKDFRQALGPNIIRSANFTAKITSGTVYFDGFGWGHGVGLCQWGAYQMAKNGYTYMQILKYYFPGSELK